MVDERKQPASLLAKYAEYSQMAVQFLVAVVLFTIGGYWIDGKVGTTPWLTLLGFALGFSGGLYSLMLTYARMSSSSKGSQSTSEKHSPRSNRTQK